VFRGAAVQTDIPEWVTLTALAFVVIFGTSGSGSRAASRLQSYRWDWWTARGVEGRDAGWDTSRTG